MTELIELLRTPSTLWILIGVILLIVEFAMPGLIVLFFGVGAILTGFLCLLFDPGLNGQLAFFTVASIVMLFALRGYLKPILSRRQGDSIPNAEEYEGEQATVTEAIEPGEPGKVEFHGAEWQAEAEEPLAVGDRVTIRARNNLTLSVTKN